MFVFLKWCACVLNAINFVLYCIVLAIGSLTTVWRADDCY